MLTKNKEVDIETTGTSSQALQRYHGDDGANYVRPAGPNRSRLRDERWIAPQPEDAVTGKLAAPPRSPMATGRIFSKVPVATGWRRRVCASTSVDRSSMRSESSNPGPCVTVRLIRQDIGPHCVSRKMPVCCDSSNYPCEADGQCSGSSTNVGPSGGTDVLSAPSARTIQCATDVYGGTPAAQVWGVVGIRGMQR